MKAIICTARGDLHIFTFTREWTQCQCGSTRARWEDPAAGTVVVDAGDREAVRLLGLSNRLLLPAVTAPGQSWQDFRRWHDDATDAPGYIFDASRAGCWAVIARIGTTTDTRWATPDEHLIASQAAT